MSLINQMLKDLDQRRQQEPAQVAEVTAVTVSQKTPWLLWLVGGISAVALMVVLYWWGHRTVDPVINEPTFPPLASAPSLASPADNVSGVVKSMPQPLASGAEQIVTVSTELVASQLIAQDNGFRLVLEFNQPSIFNRLPSQDSQQLQLLIDAQLSRSLSDHAGALIDELSIVAQGTENVLVLRTDHDVDWKVFSLAASSDHGWRLVVQATPLVSVESSEATALPVVDPPVSKDPVTTSGVAALVKQPLSAVDQQQQQLHNQAITARRQGRLAEAQQWLTELLAMDPQANRVRRELLAVLMERQQFSKAIGVARQGRLHQSDTAEQLTWLLLEARLLAETDQHRQALMLLRQSPAPSLASSPDFYALQAALLQQMADYSQAAQLYRALCTSFPDRGDWWIGWAVSAAQLNHRAEAIRYFEQALATKGLAVGLKQYATQQLGRLRESR